MFVLMTVIFLAVCFWGLMQEANAREQQYEKHCLSAYFKTDFGQVYVIRSSEIFIGSGHNSDIRIHIPGLDRKKNRWWGKRKLGGIAPIHAHAVLKEDGQFYVRNLSNRFPVYMEFGDERKTILPADGDTKLYHGVRLVFGGCRLTFCRGGGDE